MIAAVIIAALLTVIAANARAVGAAVVLGVITVALMAVVAPVVVTGTGHVPRPGGYRQRHRRCPQPLHHRRHPMNEQSLGLAGPPIRPTTRSAVTSRRTNP